jgi:hypothetical protein
MTRIFGELTKPIHEIDAGLYQAAADTRRADHG